MNAIGGASGDMLLASLVDCGLDIGALSSALTMIGASGIQLEPRKEDRQGVTGTYGISGLKAAMEMRGAPAGFARSPHRGVGGAEKEGLQNLLDEAGVQ